MRVEISTTPNLASVTPAIGDNLVLRDASNGDLLALGAVSDVLALGGITSATQTALDGKVNGTTRITVSTTAPSSPAVGDLWVDTN